MRVTSLLFVLSTSLLPLSAIHAVVMSTRIAGRAALAREVLVPAP